MSGDLEDFLRRAAQRRQAKTTQQPSSPATRQRPQYSDRKSERVVDTALTEEPLTAELVPEVVNPLAAQQRRLEESRKAAAQAEAEAAKKLAKVKGRAKAASRKSTAFSGVVAADLARLLADPQGIRQAIILREVLERPEHRW